MRSERFGRGKMAGGPERMEWWVEPAGAGCRAPVGRCPDCGTSSSSCHSRYVRTLSDLPISGAMVKVRLSVRRFRCKLGSCRRKTFSEALGPGIGRRHGRRVARCDDLVHAIGLALGGRPGSRMMTRLAAPWSKDTLLRAVRREAAAASPAPAATVIRREVQTITALIERIEDLVAAQREIGGLVN